MPPEDQVKLPVGVVVIGRNEGLRLGKCFSSAKLGACHLVYVDSGSTDESVLLAESSGFEVVKLDFTRSFTAARARNAGAERLLQMDPHVPYVHFVDGDCELVSDWLERAVHFLEKHQDIVIVCGRRRERHPERSVYNLLCDIEWNTEVGEANECGGDALVRFEAFRDVRGFCDDLIAGEEPDLCVRLRRKGWRIWRLDADMTLHDAAITRFSQWWRRAVRGGYAYAEGASLHREFHEQFRVLQRRRALIWGMGIPLLISLLSIFNIYFLFLVFLFPIQIVRIAFIRGAGRMKWWIYATFVTISKFPECQGIIKFYIDKLLGRKSAIIEYK